MTVFATIKKPSAQVVLCRGVVGYENQRDIQSRISRNVSESWSLTDSLIKFFRIRRPLLSIRPNVSPEKLTLGLSRFRHPTLKVDSSSLPDATIDSVKRNLHSPPPEVTLRGRTAFKRLHLHAIALLVAVTVTCIAGCYNVVIINMGIDTRQTLPLAPGVQCVPLQKHAKALKACEDELKREAKEPKP